MYAKEFILIDEQILLGTKYLSMERGYIQGKQTEKLTFVITSVALWEANDIDLKKIEDISNAPLRTFGELSKNAIKVSSKEQTLHRCSCNKKVFKIFQTNTTQQQ